MMKPWKLPLDPFQDANPFIVVLSQRIFEQVLALHVPLMLAMVGCGGEEL
jgi:hypothetical protein